VTLALPITDDLLDALADRLEDRLRERQRWAHVESLADYLGCDVRRVYDLRERGLPAKRIGKRLVFALDEVEDWIEREGVRV
jgi:excisionase family DNA binding protein